MRGRASVAVSRSGTGRWQMRGIFASPVCTSSHTSRRRAVPRAQVSPNTSQLRYGAAMCSASAGTHVYHQLLSAVRRNSGWAMPSSIFVRFQPTPNDACYKFYVDDMTFLPPGSHTMMFDSSNSYQSPLAHTLLDALPMVEEVTIGSSFVTVRRVEDADAKAAARLFAMKFHGVQGSGSSEMDTAAAAARSQALQQRVEDARGEGESSNQSTQSATTTAARPSPTSSSSGVHAAPSGFAAEAPIEMAGFTVSPSAQDEEIDEAAIEALIASTDWSELKFHVSALLTDHISSGSAHVDPNAPNPHADTLPAEGDSEVVLMIKELVATTIRPQLQDDGGDLRFVGFDVDGGEMQVELLGACRTCKSSKTTLVDLIERTTRHWIPEVQTVKDVSRLASPYQRFAEEAMAEAETSPSVAELLHDMESTASGEDGETAAAAAAAVPQRVQFASAAAAGGATTAARDGAGGSYRIVREVKASTPEPQRDESCTAAAAASTASASASSS